MSPELRHRLTFGPLMAGALIAAITYDLHQHSHLGILAVAILVAVPGAREYVRLARTVASDLRLAPILTCVLLLVGEAALRAAGWFHARPQLAEAPTGTLIIAFGLGWALLEQLRRRGTEGCFAHVGATTFGILYLGLPLNILFCLADLRVEDGAVNAGTMRGGALLMVFLGAVKLGDVSAFAGGKMFGRHKMCPSISPGKTWEGFASSFIGAIGGTYLFAWLAEFFLGVAPFSQWWYGIIWGVVLGPLGVLGDLAESAMKRAAGIKDSGNAVPGFGGVLDLFDALVIAAPAAYGLALVLG